MRAQKCIIGTWREGKDVSPLAHPPKLTFFSRRFLKHKISQKFGIPCFDPANGVSVTINTSTSIPVRLQTSLYYFVPFFWEMREKFISIVDLVKRKLEEDWEYHRANEMQQQGNLHPN
jgi:hypothetical protein